MNKFYDGYPLLHTNDLNGDTPEIFITVGNRTAGKTVFWSSYLLYRFKNFGEKFMLLYRYANELENIGNKFFDDIHLINFNPYIESDIKGEYFKNDVLTEIKRDKGKYVELLLNDNLCGYAIALNNANYIKRIAPLFIDVKRMFMDEIFTEDDRYLKNEVSKLISIHMSCCRGGGKRTRYLPVILVGNKVSTVNPYMLELGISERLQTDTKLLRGNGYVLEITNNENATKELSNSKFNAAFSKNKYFSYATNTDSLLENNNLIVSMPKNGKCVARIKSETGECGVYSCGNKFFLHNKYDINAQLYVTNLNYVSENSFYIKSYNIYGILKNTYAQGKLFFTTQLTKKIFFDVVRC